MIYGKNKKQKGMVALLSVLIIGSIALILAHNFSFLNLGNIDFAYFSAKKGEVQALAEACVEDALYRLKNDNNLLDNFTELDLGNGYCDYSIEDNGDYKKISVDATLEDKYFAELRVDVLATSSGIVIKTYD